MSELVRVRRGRHRRASGEVFEEGEVFEATETELDAFGDRFERVEKTDDGVEAVEQRTTATDGPAEAGEYRLVRGGTHHAGGRVVREGETVHLSEAEVEAFGDKFERVDNADDEADGKSETGTESSESDENTETDVQSGSGSEATEGSDGDEDDDVASESDTDDADSGETEVETNAGEISADLPDDYRELQALAKDVGIDARQSKAELKEQLRDRREA
jgi:hypothetical protein